jgi:hypothetical protein
MLFSRLPVLQWRRLRLGRNSLVQPMPGQAGAGA